MSILLYDYSPIPEKLISTDSTYAELCKNLQKELDKGNIKIEQLFVGKDDSWNKEKLKLFGSFNGEYYTGKYVGILSYQGHTIQILSRFDRPSEVETDKQQKNFFLPYVFSKVLDIPVYSFPELNVDSQSGEFWDFLLAKLFMDQLKVACDRGLYRQYRTFHYNNSSPKGMIDIARHIKFNHMQNGKCAYSAREYTLNNPINQLILTARDCLLRRQGAISQLVKNEFAKNANLRIALQEIEYSINIFQRPSEQMILHQTECTVTHTVYKEYEQLRETSRLIVRRFGLDTFQTGSSRISGMVSAMDRMWELFLEKTVFCHLTDTSVDSQVTHKILEGEYTIRPDFVLDYQNQQFIFDAKYKSGWSELYERKNFNDVRDDLYQIISYMHILKSRCGGILFPMVKKANEKTYWLMKNKLPDQLHFIPVQIPQSGDSFYSYTQAFDENCKLAGEKIKKIITSNT